MHINYRKLFYFFLSIVIIIAFIYLSPVEKTFLGLPLWVLALCLIILSFVLLLLVLPRFSYRNTVEENKPADRSFNLLSFGQLAINGRFKNYHHLDNPLLDKVALCFYSVKHDKHIVITFDTEGKLAVNRDMISPGDNLNFDDLVRLKLKEKSLFIEYVDRCRIILEIKENNAAKWINLQIDASDKYKLEPDSEIPSGAFARALKPENKRYKEADIESVLAPFETELYSFQNIILDIYGNIITQENN